MTNIKFGTDGWRAIIAQEYTVDNVMRVAEGTAHWLKKNNGSQVVIGYDCRFGGLMFSQVTAQVLGGFGIKVLMDKNFATTPMVSLGVAKTNSDLGVVITASHNPPSYNGYKLKSKFGGPMVPVHIAEVEAEIPDSCTLDVLPSLEELEEKGLLEYPDLETMYLDHVTANFDLDAIRNARINLAYDAMFGAGQNAVKKLFPHAHFLHCEYNPSFLGQAPEPIHRNLGELSQLIKDNDEINMGLANDGDADRIGLYDEDGHFVDSHHILLLLLLYMREYKKQDGKVIITFSVTDKMVKLAEHFGLDYEVTKIGFKYIAEIMTEEDVIVGGEESGGLAVKGHIPERDGIWIGLMIMEFMAVTGKTIKELIQDVYALVGPFHSDRDDLHITNEQKMQVVQMCEDNPYSAFGDYQVQKVEKQDGTKFWLADDKWVMIRPSGTEPVLRVYCQAPDAAEVRQILDATRDTIL